jgi:hypothetical protein
MTGPGFCNVLGSGQWNLGTDLDNAVSTSINRAIDDVITPQVNKLKQKSKEIQTMYNDLGNYILQKIIVGVAYILLFVFLSYYLYSAAQGGTFSKLSNVFSQFTK